MQAPDSPTSDARMRPKPDDDPAGLHGDRRDKPNLIDGRLLILGSALGCVVLFFIVLGSLRSVEQHVQDSQPQLIWSERAAWHAPAVIRVTLVKPNAANAQYTYNKPRYRDPGFVISTEEEQAVLTCAQFAASPDFADDSSRQGVLQHAVTQNNFYAQYLLATWYELQGDTQTADTLYQQAFTNAPKIIAIRYTDPEGKPIQSLTLDRIEIGCDRVVDEGASLDQRLVLIYPNQTTDKTGRVYLPVYDTTYRPVYLPQPEGYEITYAPNEGWFKLPTHLGTVNATVRKSDPQ